MNVMRLGQIIEVQKSGLSIPAPGDFELRLETHPNQGMHNATGVDVLFHLRERGLLLGCLSQRDGEEIQRLGCYAYQQVFGNAHLLLWRSDNCARIKDPTVPLLVNTGKELQIHQLFLHVPLGTQHTTPRLIKRTK